jgi:hypothetical protein
VAVLVPQLPLAGLGQHLVVVFAGELADAGCQVASPIGRRPAMTSY